MNLRPMTMADADKMHEWKNYRETREFSIASKDEIEKGFHYDWLKRNMEYFQVIELGSNPAGAIRLQDKEISVWIDREFRGKGLATWAIENVSKKGDFAKIVDGNIASMKCFIRAGYEPHSYSPPTQHLVSGLKVYSGYYIFQR